MPETPAALGVLKQVQTVLRLYGPLYEQLISTDRPIRQAKFEPNDAAFVCIDCEAYEHDLSKLTEIGIAVLDTRDLKDIDAGDNAVNWLKLMKHAHFRVLDYKHLVNRRYVKGREEYFNFGASTWIHLADALKVLDRVFADPARLSEAADFNIDIEHQNRSVLLVGHGIKNDDAFLKHIGFSFARVTNIKQNIDTEVAAGSMKKKTVSLKRLLLGLDIDARNLHNGGNDAAYTLQALILLAFKAKYDSVGTFAAIDATPRKGASSGNGGEMSNIVYGGTTNQPLPSGIRDLKFREDAQKSVNVDQTGFTGPALQSTGATGSA